jgi:hypothetical protein
MGERMEARRAEIGLRRQHDAAHLAGHPQSRWSEWLKVDPMGLEVRTLAAIAGALQCSLDWLVYGRTLPAAATPADPAQRRALELLAQIDPNMPASIRDALAGLRVDGDVPPLSKLRACYWALVG